MTSSFVSAPELPRDRTDTSGAKHLFQPVQAIYNKEGIWPDVERLPVKLKALAAIPVWLLIAPVGYSHHNFNAYFDVQGRVTVEGVITEVRMANPHSRITMEVENERGKGENWVIETGTGRTMAADHGWTVSTVPVGAKAVAHGFPAFSGRSIMALIHFTFEDGREVRGNMDRYLRASEPE